jgi:hypothetical protein
MAMSGAERQALHRKRVKERMRELHEEGPPAAGQPVRREC